MKNKKFHRNHVMNNWTKASIVMSVASGVMTWAAYKMGR